MSEFRGYVSDIRDDGVRVEIEFTDGWRSLCMRHDKFRWPHYFSRGEWFVYALSDTGSAVRPIDPPQEFVELARRRLAEVDLSFLED